MMLIQRKLVEIFSGRKHCLYNNSTISKYRDTKNYISLYDKFFDNLYAVKAKCKIDHSSEVNFGNTISNVKKKLKVPYSIIKVQRTLNVLFYKMRIGKYKIDVELHFFKNKLTHFKYTFPLIENKKEIKDFIKQKYLDPNQLIDFEKNGIVDDNEGYLKVFDEVNFGVFYFTTRFGFFEYFREVKENQEKIKQSKKSTEITELFEKL